MRIGGFLRGGEDGSEDVLQVQQGGRERQAHGAELTSHQASIS
jgi:hypothetical protein